MRKLTNLTNQGPGRILASMETVNLYEAKSHLSELVERASRGEEIVIAKAGKPKARLVPLEQAQDKRESRRLGQNLLGITYIAPDFDDPLPEDILKDFGL